MIFSSRLRWSIIQILNRRLPETPVELRYGSDSSVGVVGAYPRVARLVRNVRLRSSRH